MDQIFFHNFLKLKYLKLKEKNLTFREAYDVSSQLVNFAEKKGKTLNKISLDELKKIYKDLDESVLRVFDVKNSMNSKNSYGGTSSNNVKKMIKKYKKNIK